MTPKEIQKSDAELTVKNILLMDTRLGPAPTVSADTMIFLEKFTRLQAAGDLFVAIQEINLN